MSTGIVVFYDSVRGFGFVKPSSGGEKDVRASVGAGAGRMRCSKEIGRFNSRSCTVLKLASRTPRSCAYYE